MYTWSEPRSAERLSPSAIPKDDFYEAIVEAYAVTLPGVKILFGCCAEERHAAGNDYQRAKHYHAIVKADKVHRFKSITGYLQRKGIYVHCSTSHSDYATAFRYLTLPSKRKPASELDANVVLVDGAQEHPPKHVAATPTATANANAATGGIESCQWK